MRPKLSVGSVVGLPLDDKRWIVAHSIGCYERDAFYLLVFGDVFPNIPSLEDAIKTIDELPILAGLTLDAKVFHGNWPVLGILAVGSNPPLPAYKITTVGGYRVESFSAQKHRAASESESDAFRYRTVVAPVRIERAAQAYFGLAEWKPEYDELRPPPEAEYSIVNFGSP